MMNTPAVSSGLGLTIYIELRQPSGNDALSVALTIDKVVDAYFGSWPEERRADLSGLIKGLIRRRDSSLRRLQWACLAALTSNKAKYT